MKVPLRFFYHNQRRIQELFIQGRTFYFFHFPLNLLGEIHPEIMKGILLLTSYFIAVLASVFNCYIIYKVVKLHFIENLHQIFK